MWRGSWGRRPAAENPAPRTGEPTDEALIERVAQEIVSRRLAAPATFLLESSKPVSFIASQGLVVLGPFVDAALDVPDYDAFVGMMEKRENLEKLLVRIEELEDARLADTRRKKDAAPSDGGEGTHGPVAD